MNKKLDISKCVFFVNLDLIKIFVTSSLTNSSDFGIYKKLGFTFYEDSLGKNMVSISRFQTELTTINAYLSSPYVATHIAGLSLEKRFTGSLSDNACARSDKTDSIVLLIYIILLLIIATNTLRRSSFTVRTPDPPRPLQRFIAARCLLSQLKKLADLNKAYSSKILNQIRKESGWIEFFISNRKSTASGELMDDTPTANFESIFIWETYV
uniref:Uncharacterized protein n=1 Tax=Glossina palpalis gambiensis TaxID=67801 RepID=A0A1B0C447_9MUSC